MGLRTFTGFIAIIEIFSREYEQAGDLLTQYLLAQTVIDQVSIERELVARLTPIFRKYFNASAVAANQLVERNIATLSNALRVPFKYNKNVIDRIKGMSVFNGYFTDVYPNEFTRGEIDRLKRRILSAVYRDGMGLPHFRGEEELAKEIADSIGITERRARLVARNETQRLRVASQKIFYEEPKVKEKYKLTWRNRGGNVRESHSAMNGRTANENGQFYSDDVGFVDGPGIGGPVWFTINCKCYLTFDEI